MDDDSLDDVATNVVNKSRRRVRAGRKLANTPLTRAYLEAGYRLVERELLGDLAVDKVTYHPLATLTRDKIIEEARAGVEVSSTVPKEGSFRDRWPVFPDFMGDLIRYVLRGRTSLTNRVLTRTSVGRLCRAPSFSAAVHEVSYQDMKVVHGEPMLVRFQYLMTAMADHAEAIQSAIAGVYKNSFDYWRSAYRSVLEARGARFRPGITLDEFTVMLTGMAEGLGLRHIGELGGRVIDHHHRRALLGKAVNLLIAAAIDPGDGRPIEAVVDELMAVTVPAESRPRMLAALRARAARRRG